ncbi:MAG: hypothetical protein KAT35_04645, partial [Candidatus Aenigmarchaeota archaeon]|nr:hypothetical protein [Candidatus Aenigmarchaeota archaeon]
PLMEILSGRREKLLFLSITFLGISHIVTQLVAIREFLNIFYGNEIVFGIILANWMLLMGIGSYLGKFVKNVRGKMELLIVSQIGVAFLPFLLIFMVRAIKTQFFMFGVSADLIQIFSASLLILAPYGLLSGLLLTLACSVFKLRRTEEQIGSVYFIDNIGDILGGALFSFVLVFFLNSFQMAFVVFFINLLAALILSGFLGRRTLAGFTLILLVASSALFFSFDLNMTTTRSMFPGQDVIYQKDTPYGNIVVTRTGNQLNFFENGLPLFSTENTMSNEETVHYAMIQHEIPKKVLLITGGVAGTLDEILKYDVERIDYVELDPRIIELGRLYTDNLNAEKINIINGDGRFFVKNAQDTY